jgi:hypoxanthine phosphoribosyltransferase
VPARDLISEGDLRARVRELGAEISAAYPDGVVLIGVLKGSVLFFADLVRAITVPVEVDFLAISSYGEGTGRVRIVKDLDIDIAGRDVVLVEDIVDTGLTLNYLIGQLLGRQPRSLSACTLLDRRGRRLLPTPLRFVGFPVEDDFALGYGLDYGGRYRNLDHIVAGDVTALRGDPTAHVQELYAG